MFSSKKRIQKAYKNAKRIPFDDTSKFILFSDCHRGDNGLADDFVKNRNIYEHALKYYLKNDFTYIELGDGDELWENKKFKNIFEAHKNIFGLLVQFQKHNRLHFIYGNHDRAYANPNYVRKNLSRFYDKVTGEYKTLFESNLMFNESIILEYQNTKQELFLLHGHQAEFMNSVGWKLNRFMVYYFWKPLQVFGIFDPTSPAKNHSELLKVERRIKKWMEQHQNPITIFGHTHRPRFPLPTEPPLFNDGSCVHPRSITGLEIENGMITLIKWHVVTTEDGYLFIDREILEGPTLLSLYST